MSSFPPFSTIYTCAGVSFVRLLDNDHFEPWADSEAQFTKDAVLGGNAVYVDIGTVVASAFAFRAMLLTEADRTTLRTALGTQVTLANADGLSDSAVLTKATRINGPLPWLYMDLSFELLP